MPRTDNLPYAWWDSPNIHFCTIKDFRELCEVVGAKMDRSVALNAWGSPIRLKVPWWFWNLFGEQAVFLLSRKNNPPSTSSSRPKKRPQDGLRRLGSIRLTSPGDGGYRGDGDRPARLDS